MGKDTKKKHDSAEQAGESLSTAVATDEHQEPVPEAEQVDKDGLDAPAVPPPECAVDHDAVEEATAQETEIEPEAKVPDQGETDEKCVHAEPLPNVAAPRIEKTQPRSFFSCCRAV